jgi:hypothetical protein
VATREQAGQSLSAVAAQLARRWATQRLAAVQAYGRILADYGQGHASSGATLGAVAKLAVEEAARYPADAIAIATDYATAVARRTGIDLGVQASPSAPSTVVKDLELAGPLGGEAAGEFYLANPHDHAVSVSFAASNFISPHGEPSAGPVLEPAHAVVLAGAEQRVAVRATLDDKDFRAGVTYIAHVSVTGFEHMILRIRLTVLDAR